MFNKKIFLIFLLLCSFNVDGKTSNILKLSCEYNPNLIKKNQRIVAWLIIKKLIDQ